MSVTKSPVPPAADPQRSAPPAPAAVAMVATAVTSHSLTPVAGSTSETAETATDERTVVRTPPPREFPKLGDRYQVIGELGRGGMGSVFLARDLQLGRDVAIKVLNEGPHSPQQLQRFEQEARAVAALDHRNVLAIHDIAAHEGTRYIVSELLRGETLRQRLSKGPLPAQAAVDLAIQLAHGLAAAHEKGIVHRDLKPENIFITNDGSLKILDFGIAKVMASAPAGEALVQTMSGVVLGTAEYMSPEQVRGLPVDQRSDVFAFGGVLYEMLAGRRPFQRATVVEAGFAVLNMEPPPLPEGVPADLKKMVRRCLEKAPENRYPSAREVARELELRAKQPGPAEGAAPDRRAFRLRPALVALGLAVLIGAALLWIAPVFRPAAPVAAHAPLTLLVADFKNDTGEAVFDGTFEPILTIALEGASFVNAYRRQDARRIAVQLKLPSDTLDEATARLVALREGVDSVIAGSISPQGKGYKLSLRLIEPREGKLLVERSADVPDKAEVLTALGNVAGSVRGAVGDTTAQKARASSLETFTSSSIDAAHEYSLGQEMQHRGKAEEAIAHYTKAIALDPNLGRAYAGLAVVNHNLHRREEAQKYFQKAFALIDRMTERERYRTRGLYYVVERDYDKAVEEWNALVARFPADSIGFVNLAVAQCMRRDMPKALEAGAKALRLSPANVINRSNLAVYSMYSGDFEGALRLAREVVETSPTYLTPRVVIALSEIGSGHPDRALAAYRDLRGIGKAGPSVAAQGIADLALYLGRPGDALAPLEEQIAAEQADNPGAAATKLVMLASAQLALGRGAAASASLERAVALSKSEPVLFAAARTWLEAGNEKKALALAGDLAARRAREPQAYAKIVEGGAALKRGDAAAAIRLLREGQLAFDTWVGRFDLGRAYLEAQAFAEAHEEFEASLKRRGEATALFIDEVPTYRFFPETYYWLAKAQEGLKSPAAADSYRAFVAIKEKADGSDPLIAAAKAASSTR